MLSDEVALSLTPYLKQEKEYVPWMSALNNMAYFATQFSTLDTLNRTDYYPKYKVRKRCSIMVIQVTRSVTCEFYVHVDGKLQGDLK